MISSNRQKLNIYEVHPNSIVYMATMVTEEYKDAHTIYTYMVGVYTKKNTLNSHYVINSKQLNGQCRSEYK